MSKENRIKFIDSVTRPGDAILTRGKGFLAFLFHLVLEYEHTAIKIKPGEIRHCTWPDARKDSLENVIKNKRVVIRRFYNLSDEQTQTMVEASRDLVRLAVKYGIVPYTGFIPFNILKNIGLDFKYFQNPFSRKGQKVCSTIYALIAKEAGKIIKKLIDISQITPDDIYESKEMFTVYTEEKL